MKFQMTRSTYDLNVKKQADFLQTKTPLPPIPIKSGRGNTDAISDACEGNTRAVQHSEEQGQ